MLYETLFQAKIFLSILYFGLLSGIFYDICHLIKINNKIINIILDLFFMLGFSALFIFSVHIYCYGEFRLYTIVAFIMGFIIQRKTIGKFVALFLNLIYNICVKFLNKIKNSKFYNFLSKKFKACLKKINFIKKLKLYFKNKIKNKREQNNEGIFPV